jgi:hypothetical protein
MTSVRILALTGKQHDPGPSAGLLLVVFVAVDMTQPPLFARMR